MVAKPASSQTCPLIHEKVSRQVSDNVWEQLLHPYPPQQGKIIYKLKFENLDFDFYENICAWTWELGQTTESSQGIKTAWNGKRESVPISMLLQQQRGWLRAPASI